MGRGKLLLLSGLVLLFVAMCRSRGVPSPVATTTATRVMEAVTAAAPTASLPPAVTSTETPPSAMVTPLALDSATDTPLPSALPSPTPTPVPSRVLATQPPISSTPAPGDPVIQSFSVQPTTVLPGESVTLSWTSTGGDRAVIGGELPGQLVAEGLAVPLNGSVSIRIEPQERYWHVIELRVVNEAGGVARRAVRVEIDCPYEYFFSPAPGDPWAGCPYKPAAPVQAAEQFFQGGRMIWLEGIPGASSPDGSPIGPVVFALYRSEGDTRQWERFDDTWQAGDPEIDPDVQPPEGLLQPRRGFGKVWRDNPELQERLGWAVDAEQGFPGAYQLGWQPYYLRGAAYLRTAYGYVLQLGASGVWQVLDGASAPLPGTPAPPAALTIQSFEVQAEDLPQGKRLTFTWETTGATSARITSGTHRRFIPWWNVPPNGTLTVELAATVYPDPPMYLTAFSAAGLEVTASQMVTWPCTHAYFFDPPAPACPLDEPTFAEAAEQPFEGGRMIWLAEMRSGSFTASRQIFVLYENGDLQRFDDTWTPDMPDFDPDLVPPAGLYQPVRGFGKLWRENEGLKERLGWALAPEQGFPGAWQQELAESLPSVSYVRSLSAEVFKLYGWEAGRWEFWTGE